MASTMITSTMIILQNLLGRTTRMEGNEHK